MMLRMGIGENVVENYRMWLVKELANRARRNPAYSLRSFSKSLGISAPSLSQIISGKRTLSRGAALKIIERCAMSPEQAQAFLASSLGEGWGEALKKIDPLFSGPEFEELELESFRVISDWYHYAILSLGELPDNRASAEWIAGELEISSKQASAAFQRLLKLGVIARRGKGFYQCRPQLAVPTQGFTTAIRKYHQQNLHKAEEALSGSDAPLELFSAITMAVDESQLPKARELIRQFRRRICRLMEAGQGERVYTLAVQLFPISKKKEKRNGTIVS